MDPGLIKKGRHFILISRFVKCTLMRHVLFYFEKKLYFRSASDSIVTKTFHNYSSCMILEYVQHQLSLICKIMKHTLLLKQ